MGLDVTAYECVRFVPGCSPNECGDHRGMYPEPHFYAQADGMQPGCYVTEGKAEHFYAGAYSGYNAWRRDLANAMLGVTPEVVWNDPAAFAGKSFVELVNFSDCEGLIGPRTSAKLARDFAEHRERAVAHSENASRPWFLARYDDFAAAFKLAAREGGAVWFS